MFVELKLVMPAPLTYGLLFAYLIMSSGHRNAHRREAQLSGTMGTIAKRANSASAIPFNSSERSGANQGEPATEPCSRRTALSCGDVIRV
jgi:hypothetical protein